MLKRRTVLLGAVAAGGLPRAALAQRYPDRPIRLIIPFAAGGGTDVPGRVLAEALTQILGQPVVAENRTGAGSTVGMEVVVRSPPDGYSLVIATSGPLATSRLVYPNLTFDPARDLLPISNWFMNDNILVVKANSPLRSLSDFLEAARRDPGKITYGSAGHASTLHLMGEMLQYRSGIRITHVPYRGGAAALTDLVAGNIDAAFDSAPGVVPQVRAGAVRALAICNSERSVFLPDTPTMQEQGVANFSEYSWGGVFAPLRTPAAVVARLSEAIAEAGRMPQVRERMERVFCEIIPTTPEQFAQRIRDEVARWEPVVRAAGIRA